MRNTLYIVRGIPGSGKTTFCQKNFPNLFHIENDQFHYRNNEYQYSKFKQGEAISWCIDMAYLSLSKGMDCVVSNTFTRKSFIDSYKKMADSVGADVKVYRMTGEFKNIHDVPEDVFKSMKNNFEDYPGEIFVTPLTDGSYMENTEDTH